MLRILISIIVGLFISTTYAKTPEQPKPLSVGKAFEFSTTVDKQNHLLLEWHIAPGYYLYKDHIKVSPPPDSDLKLQALKLPKGKEKKDEVLGTYEILTNTLKVPVVFADAANVKGIINLTVNYQGCSSEGFCYAPQKKMIRLHVTDGKIVKNVVVTSEMAVPPPVSEQQYVESLFDGDSDFIIVLTFLGLGLLLAFTPCVLPMIPILSGIILGHKHLTTAKAFFLSLVYVLGMAITYAVAGMIVALIGSRIQTFFQSTWAIVFGSGLFVLLALSLFGFYELELPSRWTKRLTAISNQQKSGTYIGVFLMGVLSSLIVSPCVTAPLVGVLAYIADSGDVILGGVALLALGFGMGIPLLLVGVSAGKFLPKSGAWMESVKKFFGIVLLGIAIYMLSRVLPGPFTLFLWAILLICTAMFMGVFVSAKTNRQQLFRGIGLVLVIYGVILIIGAVLGNSNPLRPWEGSKIVSSKQSTFVTVKSMLELDEELALAKHDHKPVILDFYADWCTSCVELDRAVFANPDVQTALTDYVLLRADVTKNDAFDQAILKRFNVIAPPTILFFSPEGHELDADRIVGEMNRNEFEKHLQQLNLT